MCECANNSVFYNRKLEMFLTYGRRHVNGSLCYIIFYLSGVRWVYIYEMWTEKIRRMTILKKSQSVYLNCIRFITNQSRFVKKLKKSIILSKYVSIFRTSIICHPDQVKFLLSQTQLCQEIRYQCNFNVIKSRMNRRIFNLFLSFHIHADV